MAIPDFANCPSESSMKKSGSAPKTNMSVYGIRKTPSGGRSLDQKLSTNRIISETRNFLKCDLTSSILVTQVGKSPYLNWKYWNMRSS